jgi:hypothetical protein
MVSMTAEAQEMLVVSARGISRGQPTHQALLCPFQEGIRVSFDYQLEFFALAGHADKLFLAFWQGEGVVAGSCCGAALRCRVFWLWYERRGLHKPSRTSSHQKKCSMPAHTFLLQKQFIFFAV